MSERPTFHLGLEYVAISVALLGIAWVAVALPILAETVNWGEDFTAYRGAAVRLAAQGSPYTDATIGGSFEPHGGLLYLYAPPLSIASEALAGFTIETGAILWYLLKVGALTLAAWRPLAWMLGTGLILLLLSLPFVGIDGYRDYLTTLANVDISGELSQNRHLTALARELGLSADQSGLVLWSASAMALGAIALSTRRDPATGYMVTAAASLLLAPLMWDHYLSMLMLPAAFLFERRRRWAIVLPLLSWIPTPFTALVAVAALLPFLARNAEPGRETGHAAALVKA